MCPFLLTLAFRTFLLVFSCPYLHNNDQPVSCPCNLKLSILKKIYDLVELGFPPEFRVPGSNQENVVKITIFLG